MTKEEVKEMIDTTISTTKNYGIWKKRNWLR